MGGKAKVQADETYYGNSSKRAKGYRKGHSHKATIVALVEPKGRSPCFHMKTAKFGNRARSSRSQCHRKSELHTDESRLYVEVGKEFAAHKTVEHGAAGYQGIYVATTAQYKCGRKFLRQFQAVNEGNLSLLQRATLAAIRERISIPPQ